MDPADADIVKAVLDGDPDEYEKLVVKYQKPIVNYICRMIRDYQLALDLAQDVFIKAYESLDSYDSKYKFSTWIYRIASNHTIDYIRKKKLDTSSIDKPIRTSDGEMDFQVETHSPSPEDLVRGREIGSALEEAVGKLSEDYRELIVLRHLNGLSYVEIAEVQNIPIGTVKTRLFRARRELMKLMEDKY